MISKKNWLPSKGPGALFVSVSPNLGGVTIYCVYRSEQTGDPVAGCRGVPYYTADIFGGADLVDLYHTRPTYQTGDLVLRPKGKPYYTAEVDQAPGDAPPSRSSSAGRSSLSR